MVSSGVESSVDLMREDDLCVVTASILASKHIKVFQRRNTHWHGQTANACTSVSIIIVRLGFRPLQPCAVKAPRTRRVKQCRYNDGLLCGPALLSSLAMPVCWRA